MRFLLVLSFAISFFAEANIKYQINYDESKVPKFKIPKIIKGKKSINNWENNERAQVLSLIEREMFGVFPKTDLNVSGELLERGYVFNRSAERRQYRVTLSNEKGKVDLGLIIYRPNTKRKTPFFLALNFRGNQAINKDPNIFWHPRKRNQPRGSRASYWEVENLVNKGVGLATVFYGDIDFDKDDDFKNDIHALLPELQNRKDNFASISAWSYGLKHINSFIRRLSFVRKDRIVVMGHSRLGKTALYASANDTRFYGAISNNSGCGGAALSKRKFGETLEAINSRFPHWFANSFDKYSNNEDRLKFDKHFLLALTAPRKLYITSATEDEWADPKGEFLSTVYAGEVYGLYGNNRIEELDMPVANKKIWKENIAYHIREGKHAVKKFDWDRFVEFFF